MRGDGDEQGRHARPRSWDSSLPALATRPSNRAVPLFSTAWVDRVFEAEFGGHIWVSFI